LESSRPGNSIRVLQAQEGSNGQWLTDPKLPSNVREFYRIGETPVGHHRAQCDDPGLGEQ
jgi:hypothetical protein